MLLEAYGNPPVSDSVPVSDSFGARPEVSGQSNVSSTDGLDAPVSTDAAPDKTPNRIGHLTALLALPAGIAAYFGWRRMKKRPKSEPPAVPGVNGSDKSAISDVVVSPSESEPVYPALSLGVSDVLV